MPYWLVGGIAICVGACGDATNVNPSTEHSIANSGVATAETDVPTTVESVFYPTPTCTDCPPAAPQKQATPNAR